MKRYILFLVLFVNLPFSSKAQQIIDYGTIDTYFYSHVYPYTTAPIIRFSLSKEMMVHLSHCGSEGMTGTRMWVNDSYGVEKVIDSTCGKTGLRDGTLRLSPGDYYLHSEVTTERPGWNLDITIETSRPESKNRIEPINLGTFYKNTENGLFQCDETIDFSPSEGEGGAVRYRFTTTCKTDLSISSDGRTVLTKLDGTEIKRFDSRGDVTLEKGVYMIILDYEDGHDSNVCIELFATLSEPPVFDKDSVMTNFPPLNTPLTSFNSGHNYVLTRTMHSADNRKYTDIIQYYDGLGRSSQLMYKKITPNGANLISSQEYDLLGRISKQWLPVSTTNNYIHPKDQTSASENFYSGDNRAYIDLKYDLSPLSRIKSQYGAGMAWREKPVENTYLVNNNSTNLRCSYYYLDANNVLLRQGDYAPGQLYVSKSIDEDGYVSYTFVNKENQILLVRQINGEETHDTYYVYDAAGDMCFVLPPMIQDNILPNHLNLYAYQYKYDTWHRCIEKKLPGDKNIIRYVYDKADHLVFMQDGNQLPRNEWTFMLVDGLGREVIKGVCISSVKPIVENIVVKAYKSATDDIAGTGYATENFTYTPASLLSINYYDDYDYLDLPSFSEYKSDLLYGFTDGATPNLYDSKYINTSYPNISAKGLLTGTKTFLDTTSKALLSSFYYNAKGEIIQSRVQNHLNGLEKHFFSYTFSGKMLRHLHVHSALGKSNQNEVYSYFYNENIDDNPERLLKITHQLNNGSTITLVENSYDELGRLNVKKVHNGISSSNYAYNIRNWLTNISCPQFNQNLYYNTGTGSPAFNGNISSMSWQVPSDSFLRNYKFSYDQLNRLTKAEYGEGNAINENTGRFNEYIDTYDKQGNIKSLQRYGKISSNSYGIVDALTLTHHGNQLKSVSDTAADPTFGGGFHFTDGSKNADNEYVYDNNGNLTQDSNKKIANIQYSRLNLPDILRFTNGNTISYLYNADGIKQRVTRHSAITNVTAISDYCDNIIYENGNLSKILTPEGYITMNGTIPTYHYFVKDHQGNNRVVLDQNGMIEQVNHYYPFGGLFSEGVEISKQVYKYNGKELDQTDGLNWYDYEARYMDAALARFTAPDPLSEKYYSMSPYGYCGNNPINRIDPTGMSFDWFQHGDELIWRASMDKTITEGGKSYNNIGSTASIANEDGTFSNFYQNVGFRSNQPFNAFNHIIDNGIQGKYMSESSGLWEQGKVNLMKATVAQGREDFLNHPVTQGGISFTLFLATGGIEGIAGIVSSTTKSATKGGTTFFEGAKYSDKVLRQMSKADDIYHAFPKSVDGYATKFGQWSTKLGADGKPYQWLKMPGSYGDKTGVFEYTKDANKLINHRFFNVPKVP